jgi:DNA polymerase-3 subunit alpha
MKFQGGGFFVKSHDEMRRSLKTRPMCLAHPAIGTLQHAAGKSASVPHFLLHGGCPARAYEHVTRDGFARRLEALRTAGSKGPTKHSVADYEQRLAQEIAIIQQMQFSGYFLIVWDFVRYAREHGIPVGPGRGSAAGSLVSYSLRITDIDPLQHELFFERFLNPERISLPDIDMDFCMNRRGEVINYVTQKYGRENVAQIITFGTMAAKAAIKDVRRAMDIPTPTWTDYQDGPHHAEHRSRTRSENRPACNRPTTANAGAPVARHRRLVGQQRGVHAAGVVISPRPLTGLVPLHRTKNDENRHRLDMVAIEKMGRRRWISWG